MPQTAPLVGIILGSTSDLPAIEPCQKQLDELHIAIVAPEAGK